MTSDASGWIERLSGSSPEEFIEDNLPPHQKKLYELDIKILSNKIKVSEIEKESKKITPKIKFASQILKEIGGVISIQQEQNNITPDVYSLCDFYRKISDFAKQLEETEKSLALKQADFLRECARYNLEQAELLSKN